MSRSLPVAGVLVFGCLLAFTASAQRYDDGSYRPYPGSSGQWRDDDGRYDRDDNGPVYDYARVVRVDPIIVDGGGRQGACYNLAMAITCTTPTATAASVAISATMATGAMAAIARAAMAGARWQR